MRWVVALMSVAIVACGSSGPPASREYGAGDAQNGLTLHVHPGDTVRLTLNSTTWTVGGSSDTSVLEQEGGQVTSPAPPGACAAGEGCGTTTAVFRALALGTATIDASRVSCGEARVCVGAEATYEIKVVVA